MNEEMKKVLESIIKSIEKNHGKGSATTLDQKPLFSEERVIRSGSMGLDLALGIGGYPRARIIEIYGPEACIAGDSYLQYEVWDGNKRINHKGGSIRRLYERFNKVETDEEPRQGRHLQNNNGKFYVKSVNDEGMVIRNEVLDVVYTGEKQCYRVTTETGETLTSTDEHKYMTSHGFSPLSDLSVGEDIYVHNNTRVKGRKHYLNRPEIYVKYHPMLPTRVIRDDESNKDYLYYRGQQSRIAYEAYMNNMTYGEYVDYLDTRDKPTIERLSFLPKDIHVHHIDENFTNNDISNLQLVDPSEHGRIHARDRIKNLSFVIIPSKIVNIEKIEEPVKTYDLKCMYPYNNYIAGGIVVHNSGKTTLCLHAIKNEQENGGLCAFIDTEHALDVTYAKNLGVQTEMLLLSQPDFGEQALDILEAIVRSGDISLVVVDSVASLVPQSELEGDMGSASVGTQARLMSKAMRKITPILDATNCTIIFTNQLRMKIGVMFGSPETTSGGNALKFYASQRLDIRRIGAIKIGDEIIGNETKVKVVKNKVASPFKETTFRIMYGKGIDTTGEILDFSVAENFIKKSGAWYSYGEERIGQGRQNAIDWLEENQQIAKELEKIISEKKGFISARQIQQPDTRRDTEETGSIG